MNALTARRVSLIRRLSRLFVIMAMVIICAGVIIIPLEEHAAEPLIRSIADGLWWAVTTVSLVGYGDLVPLTVGGKILGVLLQFFGIVMVGAIVGTLTVYLDRVHESYEQKRTSEQLDRIEQQLQGLRHKTDFLIKNKETHSSVKTLLRWRL